jgi:hypothetical protein
MVWKDEHRRSRIDTFFAPIGKTSNAYVAGQQNRALSYSPNSNRGAHRIGVNRGPF